MIAMRNSRRIRPLGWLAVTCAIVSAVIVWTSDDKWLRVGLGLSAAVLAVAWAFSMVRQARTETRTQR
jgi:hypothetical protein